MALIHIAVVGEEQEPILAAVRELGADRVILIGEEHKREAAAQLTTVLKPLGVDTEFEPIRDGGMLLGTIRLVQAIVQAHKDRKQDIVVNLGAADKSNACATLSAAFVAGVKTVDMPGDELVFLPVLRFSYDEVVSEAKLAVLRALDDLGGEVEKLRDLADEAGLQDSLASYHIRGGRDGKGLVELDLVEVDRGTRGALTIRLTPMGELLARGMDM
ncbi:MAG: DUF6293 family protein [Candidatus Thermoplasmatota archaeon]|nr:DUF6293 family protein [Candidatus Thermoplasmatota archaeon]